MVDERPDGEPTRSRRGRLRFSMGSAWPSAAIAAVVVLSAVLVFGFRHHWNALALVAIGVFWAIILGGFIIAPLLSGLFADSFGQWNKRGVHPPEDPPVAATDGWDPTRPVPANIGLRIPPASPTSRSQGVAGPDAPGFDWQSLIANAAERLEGVLGEGFSAEASGSHLLLRHGEQARRVSLGQILQPPPLDVAERAQRGCLKMMDETQMFAMRVLQAPWPVRDFSAPGNLPRPRVRLDHGEIRMSWTDSDGVVLDLRPLPFGVPSGGNEPKW